ncbi:MAG: DUF3737 family protein [Clostridiales bacterium]|nr:DUF3737 family protein [Clostridiales bacterium]
MTEYKEQRFTGERALFAQHDVKLENAIFADGESPLKESSDLEIISCSFQWKYPLWYCKNVSVTDSTFATMARAGIWYTDNITLTDCLYEAPKGFRRVNGLTLDGVDFPNADETLWSCNNVEMNNVVANGDYFAMNSTNIEIENLRLTGNYSFDGCKNVTLRNGKLISKDAFWNCDNVTVYDSYICGEYLGWNSKNITFINCTIESLQGMCYMENLKMVNCRLLNTTLAFEYSTVDAEITTVIDSVKNPSGGIIRAKGIGELIMEPERVDVDATSIVF